MRCLLADDMYLAEEKSFVDADHYRVVKAAEAEKVRLSEFIGTSTFSLQSSVCPAASVYAAIPSSLDVPGMCTLQPQLCNL